LGKWHSENNNGAQYFSRSSRVPGVRLAIHWSGDLSSHARSESLRAKSRTRVENGLLRGEPRLAAFLPRLDQRIEGDLFGHVQIVIEKFEQATVVGLTLVEGAGAGSRSASLNCVIGISLWPAAAIVGGSGSESESRVQRDC